MKYPDKVFKVPGRLSSIILIFLFFSLGFAATYILNNYLTRDKQLVKTQAQQLSPIQEYACTSEGGECQTGKADQVGKSCMLSDGQTRGTVAFNLCPQQSDDIRCCVPNTQQNPPQTASATTSLSVGFDGIGPNSTPVHTSRSVTIKIFKAEGPFDVASYVAEGIITYDPTTGRFNSNSFNLGAIPSGKYQMVIQEEKYLDEQLLTKQGEKLFDISANSTLEVSPVNMKAGDVAPGKKGDNFISIIDYNAVLGCIAPSPPSACLNKEYADLNDDGVVDQRDLDILMKNFGDIGFSFQTDQFECTQDPACGPEKSSLQLCSLICTKKSQRS